MSYSRSLPFLFLIFAISMNPNPSGVAAEMFPMAKPGCKERCGFVRIRYPFGIGSDCAFSESFVISCRSSGSINSTPEDSSLSKPYLKKLNLEVLEINLWHQTITINTPVPQITGRWRSTDLAGTPFLFSRKHNTLMFSGSGNVLLLSPKHDNRVLSACTSMCHINCTVTTGGCYGVKCCETNIPFYLTSYELKSIVTESNQDSCAPSAFLADRKFLLAERVPESFTFVPVVLVWTITNPSDISSIPGCIPKERYLQVNQTKYIVSYTCKCENTAPPGTMVYEFNPYLDGACNYAYHHLPGSSLRKNLAVTIIGMPFLMVVWFALYKVAKQRHQKRSK